VADLLLDALHRGVAALVNSFFGRLAKVFELLLVLFAQVAVLLKILAFKLVLAY
jgi:hypothetical protein